MLAASLTLKPEYGCGRQPEDAVLDFIQKGLERIAVEEARNAKLTQLFHVTLDEEE